MKNICELLNIEYPIIQGAMAKIANSSIAGAVSEGGGLGIIAAGGMSTEWVREEIRKVREITDKPFGVNIMLMDPNSHDVIDLVCEEKVPVVTTGAGNPGKHIAKLKEHGIIVIPVVASVATAKRAERAGADAIIGEGLEAGGHIGESTTMALIPQLADKLTIPVIAAGGIADGRGMASAFILGAKGVQVGTRFLVATECAIPSAYKEKVIMAKDTDTVVTGRSTGHPVRVIKNKLSRKVQMLERENAPHEEIEKLCIGKLSAAVFDGDVEYGSVMAGQIAGLVKKEETAHEIMEDITNQCDEILNKGNTYI